MCVNKSKCVDREKVRQRVLTRLIYKKLEKTETKSERYGFESLRN